MRIIFGLIATASVLVANPPTWAKKAAPPAANKTLTKAQLEEAKALVRANALHETYDTVYKKIVAKLGEPMKKDGDQLFWFGADETGKCFDFFIQNVDGKAGGAMISAAMDPAACTSKK